MIGGVTTEPKPEQIAFSLSAIIPEPVGYPKLPGQKDQQKHIMQAEFGKTNAHDQANWLINAYTSIKRDFPGLRAAICYDNFTFQLGDDHALNKKSLAALLEIFKDPHWIMAE